MLLECLVPRSFTEIRRRNYWLAAQLFMFLSVQRKSESMTPASLALGLAEMVALRFCVIQVRIAAGALTVTC